MKATLEFNLPEDQAEFDLAVNASKWAIAMWDIDQELRARTKYAPDDFPEEAYKALQEMRDFLHETLTNHGISFNGM